MMNIYIVSLLKDSLKREIIGTVLNEFDLKYQFVDAIYGKDMSSDLINSFNFDGKISNRGYKPTPGEIGCTLSHLKIFKLMLDNQDEWACILEDDAILDEKFATFIKKFVHQKFDNKNVYMLGGQDGLAPRKFISMSLFHKVDNGKQSFSRVNFSEQYVNRTCCYVVSKHFAQKMLYLFENKFYLADDWISFKKAGVYNNLYISDFVAHPLDLTSSSIERERQESLSHIKKNNRSAFFYLAKKIYLLIKYIKAQFMRII